MTNWMELPHTYPDEEKVLRWTPYILELRQAVDALSRPTPAAPEGEVTEAMVLAGLEVFYAPVPQRERIATIYRAMRAAAPNAQAEYEARHPEEPATPLGDAAWWRAQFEHEVHMRARLEEQLEAALARPAPTQEPGEAVDREAVARAMFEWKRERRPAYVFTWDELPEQVKDIHRNDADAAIAAMGAQPSEELRLLRELERAVREAVAEYEGWYSPEVKDALAALDAAEGEGNE